MSHYPDFLEFLKTRYRITVESRELALPFHEFVANRTLPPARIVFMESQLASQMRSVTALSPAQARKLLADEPALQVIDVREGWERKSGSLPKARSLNPVYWRQIENELPRETPVLVYCHFGVRSLDAALSLSARGFQRVFTLQGGIDAWSQEVDPSIPRYSGSYC